MEDDQQRPPARSSGQHQWPTMSFQNPPSPATTAASMATIRPSHPVAADGSRRSTRRCHPASSPPSSSIIDDHEPPIIHEPHPSQIQASGHDPMAGPTSITPNHVGRP
ncbi:hypothetical protein ACLOJK_027987 [Asimina triloba]